MEIALRLKPTNLYIPVGLKKKAAAAAQERYNWKLSGLVRALLEREVATKRGIVYARFAKR